MHEGFKILSSPVGHSAFTLKLDVQHSAASLGKEGKHFAFRGEK
jgi:hypothetical protein